MRCVRIWFDKLGEVRYISHLDLMRCFTRAIRRAKIPLWFTEGFNPRPYMQFALPLSLGMQSVCESVDIRVEGEITNGEIENKLREVMPEGISIKKVTEPRFDPKYIAFGEFDIIFSGAEDPLKVKQIINDSLTQSEFIVEKMGKKGRHKELKQINLIENMKSAETKISGDDIICTIVLRAGGSTNVNPSLFSDKITEIYGEAVTVNIIRKKLFLENMEEFQ
ncbi:MAG: TIGR03936 family radical SAM-associated protein [Acutalibacteraceae bacterium]